jgi:hypothetical protein
MRRTVLAAALIAAVYGCECDPNLSYPDNSVEAQAGLGWIDGYVAACTAYREAHRCD